MPKLHKICYDKVLPHQSYAPHAVHSLVPGGPMSAVMPTKKQWLNGTKLHVRFMGGTPEQHALIKKHAPQWGAHCNLEFVFDDSPQAQIRISFQDDGAWSYVGTDNLSIPLHAATMNFGWVDEGVILHEFGHAIGLGHEHQNPDGGLLWDEAKVIEDLGGPPNYWNEATVRHNVLKKYAVDQIKGTKFDPKSIMLYEFPASWTTNGVSTQGNEVLSDTDKAFIGGKKGYPQPNEVIEIEVATIPVVSASIGEPGEEDRFSFKATTASRYTIETIGASDLLLRLFGPNDRTALVAEDDDSGPGYNARIERELSPGDYFVQVRHYSESQTGNYGIKVSR